MKYENICDLGQLESSDFSKVVNQLAMSREKTKAASLAAAMQNWFTEYPHFELETKEYIAKNIIGFAKCPRKPWFTDMKGKDRVYRGISRPIFDLRKVKFMRMSHPRIIGTVSYDPRIAAQSWSTDVKRAESFTMGSPDSWRHSVRWTMSMKLKPSNILFGTVFTRLMSGFPNEEEVIVHIPSPTMVTVMVDFNNMRFMINDLYARQKSSERRDWDEFLEHLIGKANTNFLWNTDEYRRLRHSFYGKETNRT